MASDTRVHADAVDDLLCVESLHLGVGVKLIEVADSYGEECVGKKLDGLCLGRVCDKRLDVLRFLASALFLSAGSFEKEVSKHLTFFFLIIITSNNNTAGVKIIVKSFGFS